MFRTFLSRVVSSSLLTRPRPQTYYFIHGIREFNTNTFPLLFHATQTLCGEPMKKKKRLDPAVQRMRDERKRKRLEKQIRKLERTEKQLKPIDELEVPRKIIQEKKVRARNLPSLTQDVIDQRTILKREWSDYKRAQFEEELNYARRMVKSQAKALEQLKIESVELHQEAIQFDLTLTPYMVDGPTETPPVDRYECLDGCFNNITRKWS